MSTWPMTLQLLNRYSCSCVLPPPHLLSCTPVRTSATVLTFPSRDNILLCLCLAATCTDAACKAGAHTVRSLQHGFACTLADLAHEQVFGDDIDLMGGARLGRHVELSWELAHCGKLQTLRKLLLLWHKDVTNKVCGQASEMHASACMQPVGAAQLALLAAMME